MRRALIIVWSVLVIVTSLLAAMPAGTAASEDLRLA